MEGKTVAAKFKSLRKIFKANLKKLKQLKSGAGCDGFTVPWAYFSSLQFLQETEEATESFSNLDSIVAPTKATEEDELSLCFSQDPAIAELLEEVGESEYNLANSPEPVEVVLPDSPLAHTNMPPRSEWTRPSCSSAVQHSLHPSCTTATQINTQPSSSTGAPTQPKTPTAGIKRLANTPLYSGKPNKKQSKAPKPPNNGEDELLKEACKTLSGINSSSSNTNFLQPGDEAFGRYIVSKLGQFSHPRLGNRCEKEIVNVLMMHLEEDDATL
ncbi:uncharacterized protein LOC129227856 [Uloborus diversus]|uniref:uncharacterized protein LOC129227856 n=1 Tax=Uloborus diversus TaxID=327109 RepID=UPI00240A8191|nr:uncharacterized protein LOC129227856 [Uloborus diversus]